MGRGTHTQEGPAGAGMRGQPGALAPFTLRPPTAPSPHATQHEQRGGEDQGHDHTQDPDGDKENSGVLAHHDDDAGGHGLALSQHEQRGALVPTQVAASVLHPAANLTPSSQKRSRLLALLSPPASHHHSAAAGPGVGDQEDHPAGAHTRSGGLADPPSGCSGGGYGGGLGAAFPAASGSSGLGLGSQAAPHTHMTEGEGGGGRHTSWGGALQPACVVM